MHIISSNKLLLTVIIQAIHFSEQMELIKESSSIDICIGKDVELLWKVDEEENKISKLEWYFNNKSICISPSAGAFTVNTPYLGRIERIGKTGILLKNVSLDDQGIYILFPLLAWSTSQNMQKIFLRVLEPPTNECTCKTGHPLNFTCEQTASYCGRPQVSLVWKRKQTFEVLGDGICRLINSSLQDNEILCCQDGEAMKCVDDNRQFCTSVSIPHRDDERPSEHGSTQHTDSVITPVPQQRDTGSVNLNYNQPFIFVVTLIASSLAAIFAFAVLIITCYRRKNKKDIKECVPMMEINCKLHEAVKLLQEHDPVHETLEATTKHRSSNDSKPMIEIQELQQTSLFPVLETKEAISEHPPSNDSETMKEMPEVRLATLCKICSVNKMNMVFTPCSHIATCASCSINLYVSSLSSIN